MKWSVLLEKYAHSHRFSISRSVWLDQYLLFVHLVAVLSVFASELELNYKLILLGLILISLSLKIYQQFNFHAIYIDYQSPGEWKILQLNGFEPIQILPTTIITPVFIILHFKFKHPSKQTFFIYRDMMSEDEFRQLRVALKIAGL